MTFPILLILVLLLLIMSNISSGFPNALNNIFTEQYRVAIGNASSLPSTLAAINLTEEPTLSAIPSISINNGIYNLDSTHNTSSLASSFTATYCAVIQTVASVDVAIISVEEFNQVIDTGSTLTTTHTYTVTIDV